MWRYGLQWCSEERKDLKTAKPVVVEVKETSGMQPILGTTLTRLMLDSNIQAELLKKRPKRPDNIRSRKRRQQKRPLVCPVLSEEQLQGSTACQRVARVTSPSVRSISMVQMQVGSRIQPRMTKRAEPPRELLANSASVHQLLASSPLPTSMRMRAERTKLLENMRLHDLRRGRLSAGETSSHHNSDRVHSTSMKQRKEDLQLRYSVRGFPSKSKLSTRLTRDVNHNKPQDLTARLHQFITAEYFRQVLFKPPPSESSIVGKRTGSMFTGRCTPTFVVHCINAPLHPRRSLPRLNPKAECSPPRSRLQCLFPMTPPSRMPATKRTAHHVSSETKEAPALYVDSTPYPGLLANGNHDTSTSHDRN